MYWGISWPPGILQERIPPSSHIFSVENCPVGQACEVDRGEGRKCHPALLSFSPYHPSIRHWLPLQPECLMGTAQFCCSSHFCLEPLLSSEESCNKNSHGTEPPTAGAVNSPPPSLIVKQSMPIKQVQLPPVPYAHQTLVKVNMTNYSLLLGSTGKTVVWENWHINPFQVFYTAMFLVTAYVEQVSWKAQRQHWIGPLCSLPSLLLLPYSVPNTIFTTTIYPHTKSLQNKAFEGTSLHWNPKMANMNIWKVSFQKAFKLSFYTIILSNAHTKNMQV